MNSVDFYSHFIMNKTLDFHLKDKISIFILTIAFLEVFSMKHRSINIITNCDY